MGCMWMVELGMQDITCAIPRNYIDEQPLFGGGRNLGSNPLC
jgi:hypothetical protein